MATLTQYLDYYQSLMALQYRGLPRATGNIRNYVAQVVAENFLEQLANAFTLDTAVGAQLDTIGKYIGVTRYVNGALDTPLFGFWDYTESDPDAQNPNGFYDYEDTDFPYAEFYSYLSSSTSTTALSDGQYRFLLKLQIVLNNSDNTLASIQDYLHEFFPDQITVVDNADMTLDYFVSSSVPLPISVLEVYLPKPMGVGITVTEV